MIFGGISGLLLFMRLNKFVVNHICSDFERLYPIQVIVLVFLTLAAINLISGFGFWAVYLCSVYISNEHLIHENTTIKTFDKLA